MLENIFGMAAIVSRGNPRENIQRLSIGTLSQCHRILGVKMQFITHPHHQAPRKFRLLGTRFQATESQQRLQESSAFSMGANWGSQGGGEPKLALGSQPIYLGAWSSSACSWRSRTPPSACQGPLRPPRQGRPFSESSSSPPFLSWPSDDSLQGVDLGTGPGDNC